MSPARRKRVSVPRVNVAAPAAPALPREPDTANQLAAEDMAHLSDADTAHGDRVMRHAAKRTALAITRLDRARFALRLNSLKYERDEITADAWQANVRLIIDTHYPNG